MPCIGCRNRITRILITFIICSISLQTNLSQLCWRPCWSKSHRSRYRYRSSWPCCLMLFGDHWSIKYNTCKTCTCRLCLFPPVGYLLLILWGIHSFRSLFQLFDINFAAKLRKFKRSSRSFQGHNLHPQVTGFLNAFSFIFFPLRAYLKSKGDKLSKKISKNNSMLACRVVCCSHQSDRCIRVCILLQSDCRIRVCISHQSQHLDIMHQS